MPFRHRRPAQLQPGPVLALAVLAVSVVPPILAQADLPRFEPAECPVSGAWARDARRECGWLTVQESRDNRSASTARLAVEVFRARAPNGTPPLVMLHGGPGGAGGIRIYSPFVATGPFAQHRDVVIYDQRGAGFSQPKLCPTYEAVADSARNLRTKAEKDQRWAQGRRACLAELRAKAIDPLAYNTAASAADLIDLRRTLGYATWDIFSESYGARLAQEAMIRDGPAIRSVVLASSVSRGPMRELEAAASEQRAFEHLFAACSAQPACHEAFPVIEQDFYADYERLNNSPLAISIERPGHAADTVWLDGTRLVNDIRNRLFPRAPANVARVPLLLHELRLGDRLRAARAIVGDGALGPGADPTGERALREITICYDSYSATDQAALDSVNALVRPPFRKPSDHDCEQWLPRFGDPATGTPVRSDIPTLIITGYFDDRTPIEQGRRIASTLSRAYVFEFPNEGHGARPTGCYVSILTQFFEDPSRTPDASCIAAIAPIAFMTTWESTNARP